MKKKTGRILHLMLTLCATLLFGVASSAFSAVSQSTAAAQPAPGAAQFDHSRTGFLLRDVHTTLKCEQCHVDGIFKNTPRDCAGCHTIGSRVGATPQPVNHVQTTQPCDTCHTSPTNFLVRNYKHAGISGGCNTCHNGQSLGVVSKPANHFPTLLPCESCHTNTNTFQSWRMDHTGLASNCASCHSGQFVGVVSKPVNHIATTAPCETCHASTVTFLGATYNHVGVTTGSCDTCHNGSYPGVMAKSATHIPVPAGAFCDNCHTQSNTGNFSSFLGAVFHNSYTAAPGTCVSCHNGAYAAANALGKPVNHIPATASCDTCHTNGNFTSFSGAGFHTIAANNAAIAGACANCHSGSYSGWTSVNGLSPSAKIATHIPTTAQCDSCHTATNTSNYTTFLGAGFHGVATNNVGITGTCGRAGCHDGSGANGAQGKSATHIATTGHAAAACDDCHTPALTLNYRTFLGALYSHSSPPGVCSTCHNGSSATGKPAAHIPTAAPCDQCHALPPPVGTAANFTGANFHAVATNNAAAAGTCQNCHNGSYLGYLSGNGLAPQAKSVPHIPATGSCDACHTASNTANFSTFLGAAYNHATVAAGSCATCHNGTYPGVSSQSYLPGGLPTNFVHTPTGTQPCDACHTASNTLNYTTWLGATGADHTLIAAHDCVRCHNGATAKGMSTGHIPTGSIQCDYCHVKYNGTSVITFYPGTMNHASATAVRCDVCHSGAYATQGVQYGGAQGKVSNHIPTTITAGLDCTTCHTNPTYTSATGWLQERMNHNGAQGGGAGGVYCVNCHLKGVTYLGSMQKLSHNGASVAKDCSRSSCHKPLGSKGVVYQTWN